MSDNPIIFKMAMADRRPLGLPVTSAQAAPAYNVSGLAKSPDTKMKSTISDLKGNLSEIDITSFTTDKSVSPAELSPTLRSISPDSLMHTGTSSAKKSTSSISSRDSTPPVGASSSLGSFYPKASLNGTTLGKKPKVSARVPIATGISTTIPVTGEKPKPDQEGDASLEDDVLFAIFLILYEKDPEGAGMTVKQICDILVERHPEMAQLSSKTSNLVSAKLNAYVKRVEKGDSNLKYALSREWADASPKRMVYVYRGLLTKDFHVHVKNVMEYQKQSQGNQKFVNGLSSNFSTDSFEAAKQSAILKQRRLTMYDFGPNRPAFLESSDLANLFVPYASAPVAANMPEHSSASGKETDDVASPAPKVSATPTPITEQKKLNDLDYEFEDLDVFNDTDDDSADFSIETFKKNGKRSKSMSYLSMTKKSKVLTAAAAAPRAPKTPCSHSPNAAAAAAALHAAALKAISETSSSDMSSAKSSSNNSPKSKRNWAHVVRSGFLTQEISAPEDLTLSDLDKWFS